MYIYSSKKRSGAVLVSVFSLILVSCASLGKKDCLSGDWAAIGKSDGSKGKIASDQLAAHTKACTKHGVQPNQIVYMSGHTEGVKTYCSTENGYTVGSNFVKKSYKRNTYNNVCPDDLKLGFLKGYVSGLKLGLDILHRELSDEKQELESNRSALLLLKALNSSKADRLEEKVEEGDSSVSEKSSTIDATIKEIDKWLLVEPELKTLLQ